MSQAVNNISLKTWQSKTVVTCRHDTNKRERHKDREALVSLGAAKVCHHPVYLGTWYISQDIHVQNQAYEYEDTTRENEERLWYDWDQPRCVSPSCVSENVDKDFVKVWYVVVSLRTDKIKSKRENEEAVKNNPVSIPCLLRWNSGCVSYARGVHVCVLWGVYMCVLWEARSPSSLLHQLHGNQGRGGSDSQVEMYLLAQNKIK